MNRVIVLRRFCRRNRIDLCVIFVESQKGLPSSTDNHRLVLVGPHTHLHHERQSKPKSGKRKFLFSARQLSLSYVNELISIVMNDDRRFGTVRAIQDALSCIHNELQPFRARTPPKWRRRGWFVIRFGQRSFTDFHHSNRKQTNRERNGSKTPNKAKLIVTKATRPNSRNTIVLIITRKSCLKRNIFLFVCRFRSNPKPMEAALIEAKESFSFHFFSSF